MGGRRADRAVPGDRFHASARPGPRFGAEQGCGGGASPLLESLEGSPPPHGLLDDAPTHLLSAVACHSCQVPHSRPPISPFEHRAARSRAGSAGMPLGSRRADRAGQGDRSHASARPGPRFGAEQGGGGGASPNFESLVGSPPSHGLLDDAPTHLLSAVACHPCRAPRTRHLSSLIGHHTASAARSRALRARGFTRVSASPGRSTRRVSTRQDGDSPCECPCRNLFTMRSSSE